MMVPMPISDLVYLHQYLTKLENPSETLKKATELTETKILNYITAVTSMKAEII